MEIPGISPVGELRESSVFDTLPIQGQNVRRWIQKKSERHSDPYGDVHVGDAGPNHWFGEVINGIAGSRYVVHDDFIVGFPFLDCEVLDVNVS